MALTVSVLKRNKLMNDFSVIANVTFDNGYTTGGKALLPSDFGLVALDFVHGGHPSGYTFGYDYTTQKIKAYLGGTEVANATDLSAITVRVTGVGY